VITDPAYPPVLDRWTRQLKEIRPVDGAAEISDAPLLVLHGSEDETVPSIDARVLADAHGSADLRIVPGAAHDLRNDPRAIAILLGWLDRQRHSARSNGESGA
jgi:putative redox protein